MPRHYQSLFETSRGNGVKEAYHLCAHDDHPLVFEDDQMARWKNGRELHSQEKLYI